MIGIVFVLLIITAVLMCLYFRKIILKACNEAGVDTGKRTVKVTALLFAAFLGIAGCNVFSFWAVVLFHILILSLITDFFNLIIKKYRTRKSRLWNKIYTFRIIPLLLTVLVMIYGYINLNNVQETVYTVTTDKNIRDEGYRIALVADVHYGVSADKEELQVICNEIGEKNVDIVVLCGDIVDDNTTKEGMKEAFSILSSIKNTSGIYYVYGNHDRQRYSMETNYRETELEDIIEQNGIVVLKDSVVTINDDFVIAGREDASIGFWGNKSERQSAHELLSATDKNKFILVADHQPKEYSETAKAGADLIVSGHTHGGQIWPVNIIDEIFKINEENYGLAETDGTAKAIVTSGLAGWNYPIKTASPSEYVIIHILN